MRSMLIISIELPYPPTSGGRMKSWNLVKFLSKHYHIGLACPLKYGSDKVSEFESKVPLKQFITDKVEKPRSVKTLLTSYALGIPMNVYRSKSNSIKKEIIKSADSYDIILVDHYEAFQYIPPNFKGKVIFHTHNATYLMWERFAQSDANFAFRKVASIEADRVKNYERKAVQNSDLIFASPNDIQKLVDIGADESKCRETFHLGDSDQIDLPALEFDKTEQALLYIGTLNWEANVDGLMWFLEDVWPKIKQIHPDLYFYVVGGNADQRLLDKGKTLTDVEFVGFADELEPYFQKARIFVSPLRFGSGIKVKVLNAMSRGLPTVTTTVGVEGLTVKNMKHIAVADDIEGTLENIDTLLTNEAKWLELETASRDLVRQKYTWEKVLGYMVDEINKIT